MQCANKFKVGQRSSWTIKSSIVTAAICMAISVLLSRIFRMMSALTILESTINSGSATCGNPNNPILKHCVDAFYHLQMRKWALAANLRHRQSEHCFVNEIHVSESSRKHVVLNQTVQTTHDAIHSALFTDYLPPIGYSCLLISLKQWHLHELYDILDVLLNVSKTATLSSKFC